MISGDRLHYSLKSVVLEFAIAPVTRVKPDVGYGIVARLIAWEATASLLPRFRLLLLPSWRDCLYYLLPWREKVARRAG